MEKSTPPLVPPTWEIESALSHALVNYKDPLFLVLKGHLAIERALEIAAKKRLQRPERIFDGRGPMFAMKLKLFEALYGEEVDQEVYSACRFLNKLRNDYAHQIEPPEFKLRAIDLLLMSLPNSPSRSRADLSERDIDTLSELFFYKLHDILRAISAVVFKDEIITYDEDMRRWLDETRHTS